MEWLRHQKQLKNHPKNIRPENHKAINYFLIFRFSRTIPVNGVLSKSLPNFCVFSQQFSTFLKFSFKSQVRQGIDDWIIEFTNYQPYMTVKLRLFLERAKTRVRACVVLIGEEGLKLTH